MKKICIVDKCDQPHLALSYCRSHYRKYKHHGSPISLKDNHTVEHKIEYMTWQDMRYRCNNSKLKSYKDYGGRGIKVCERWNNKDGFKNFLQDMGKKPHRDYSLDRIDNNGNYTPENCRWATNLQQAHNIRRKLSKSGERYISWNKYGNRWLIRITRNNKLIFATTSKNFEKAKSIRDNKLREINDTVLYPN